MSKIFRLIFLAALFTGVFSALAVFYLRGSNIAVLNPAGGIASKESSLIITSTLLMLIIVLPVFALTAFVAWRYRAGNKQARYEPDWDGHRAIETLWWLLPLLIITILSVIAWRSSHELDPFKPLASDKKPVEIYAVALQYKWLFLYPEQRIATVNFAQIPVDTPINFTISADAPMNSFWIPQLGGQIYAMPGMATKLHLIADKAGTYRGSSANISGSGFSRMNFTAEASSESDFSAWIVSVKRSPMALGLLDYELLAAPSTPGVTTFYSTYDSSLFEEIIAKYTTPNHLRSALTPSAAHGGSH